MVFTKKYNNKKINEIEFKMLCPLFSRGIMTD